MAIPAWTLISLALPLLARAEAVLELEGSADDNLKYDCGFHRAVAVAENGQAFAEQLKNTNFDPCCLGPDILRGLGTNRKPLKGINMGSTTGVPFYFGGREMVIFYERGQLLKVAAFRYTGYAAALSLPYGASITQGLIVGTCSNIDDYAGWFKTVEVAGNSVSFGMSGHFLDSPQSGGFAGIWERLTTHVNARTTGCNSVGLVSGATTAIVGGSVSFYERASPVITLRGDRTRKLQNLFRRAYGQAELQAPPKPQPLPAAPGQPRRPALMDFQKTHGKACNYNIPAQAWNNASVLQTLRNLSHRFPGGPPRAPTNPKAQAPESRP